MKKELMVVTVFIVLCIVPISLYPEFGVKLGFQRTDFEKEGTFDLSTYKIGLFYSVDLGDNFSFQPELYFSHHGTRTYRSGVDDYYFSTETKCYAPAPFPLVSRQKLSYIEVPLLLKYTVPLRGDLKPVLYFGGYVALRVSKEFEFDTYAYDAENETYNAVYGWRHIDIQYKKTDRGGILGVGLEHGMGKTRMYIDFRFNIGFVDVYQWNLKYDEKQNRSLSLLVGLSF